MRLRWLLPVVPMLAMAPPGINFPGVDSHAIGPRRPGIEFNATGSGGVPITLQDVEWEQVVGATASTGTLDRTAGAGAWGLAGAVSLQMVDDGDCYVEWTVSSTTTYFGGALGNLNYDENYTKQEFSSVGFAGGGSFHVYEIGVDKSTESAYTSSSVFRIAAESGVVKYYIDGVLAYTSLAPARYPVIFDAALYSSATGIRNAKIYGKVQNPAHYALFVGDSKTDHWNSQAAYTGIQNPFAVLVGATRTDTLAQDSRTVALEQGLIDAQLASAHRFTTVEAVLLNFGSAEMAAALPDETTWKNNYGYILDAINTKWPTAKLYLARPWRRGKDADSDTLAGWIATVISTRSAFAFVGPDERVWMKGADDGATYTHDGIHPNDAGYAERAAQLKAVLGW